MAKLGAAERLITAMAFERKFAKDKIQELAVITYQHVYKILLFPTSQPVAGWEREIKAWYAGCVRYTNIKGGKFSPSDLKSLLLENVFYPKDNVLEDIEFTISQNPELKARQVGVKLATHKLTEFYSVLADALYAKDSKDSLDSAFNALKS